MAESKKIILTEEELARIINLGRLQHYDEKIKNWVLKRLSGIGGIGNLTEEELIEMIRTEINNYINVKIKLLEDENLPEIGDNLTIYITKTNIYRWDEEFQQYNPVVGEQDPAWGEIV